MVCLALSGPAVTKFLFFAMLRYAPTVTLFPYTTLFRSRFGSGSVADTVDELSNAPAALIVAVTVIVTFAPEAKLERKSTRLKQSHTLTSDAVRCLKK